MSSMAHGVERIDARQLVIPSLLGLLLLGGLSYLVAFDQGAIASLITDRMLASGGILHEFFHDARHLLGVPCH